MNFLRDEKFWISLAFILPAWLVIWRFPDSNPHMILATNVLSAVVSYWLGSSLGSSDKNKIIGGAINGKTPAIPGPAAGSGVPAVRLSKPGGDEPAVG
jgi:hypothetical protein